MKRASAWEKEMLSSDNRSKRRDPRVRLDRAATPAVKELAVTTAWTEVPVFRVCRDRRGRRDRRRQPLTWTRFRPSLRKETRPVAAPPELDSCKLRWDRWALADPRDLRDPLVPLDSSGLVVTPEIPDRSASADPLEPLDPPDLPEKRVNLDAMDNPAPRVCKDQWENVDLRACLDCRVPKDTGVCRARMERRDPRDSKASPEIWENQDPSVSPVQWDLAAPAVSAVASGLRVRRVFAAATASPAPAAPRDPSDPRDHPASPASPDPKATKDSTGLKVAGAFKDRAERTVCPERRENRASKARPVSTAPTERRDREATWDPKGRPDSPDPEDRREPPVTREWLVLRVSRDNLEFLDFAV